MEPRFVIFKNARGEFGWHLLAANNEIVAQGEMYKRKESAIKAIKLFKEVSATAKVFDDRNGKAEIII